MKIDPQLLMFFICAKMEKMQQNLSADAERRAYKVGKVHVIRMIYSLVDLDHIKQSFICCYNSPDHLTLDSRNSSECFQQIA